MNYQCPKCGVDLRYKFKGIFRLTCPACGVRLFRTVSTKEVDFASRFEAESWVFAIAALLVLGILFHGSSYFLPALFVALIAFAAWRVMSVNSTTSSDWPRWTDKAPW